MKNLLNHVRHSARRISALALSAALLVSMVNLAIPAKAAGTQSGMGLEWTDPNGATHSFGHITDDHLCYHHPEHTADCGYQEAQDCDHVHNPGGCYDINEDTGNLEAINCTHESGEHGDCEGACQHIHKPEFNNYTCGYNGEDPLTCSHYGTGHDITCFDTEGDFEADFMYSCSHTGNREHDVGESCADSESNSCPHDNSEYVGGHIGCALKTPQKCKYICTNGCIPANNIEVSLGQVKFFGKDGKPVENPVVIPDSEIIENETIEGLRERYFSSVSAAVTVTVRAYITIKDDSSDTRERTATDPVTFDAPLVLKWDDNRNDLNDVVVKGAYLFDCTAEFPKSLTVDDTLLEKLAALTGWEKNPEDTEKAGIAGYLKNEWDDAIENSEGFFNGKIPQFNITVYGYENEPPKDGNGNGYVEVSSLNDLVTYIKTETAAGKTSLSIELTENIFGGQAVTIPAGCDVTLELNGHQLLYTNENIGLGTPALFTVRPNATLTIEDSKTKEMAKTETTEGVSSDPGQLGSYDGDTLTYYVTKSTEDGTLTTTEYTVDMSETGMVAAMGTRAVVWVDKDGTLNFNGGRITNANAGYHGIRSEGGTVTINGGLLVGTGSYEIKTYEEGPTSGTELAHTDSGAGIYCDGGNLTVDGTSIIAGNRTLAFGNGAGIYATNMATFEIKGDAVIAGNLSQFGGGGVFVNEKTTLNISGNAVISGNLSAYNGGGVYVEKWEDFDNSKVNHLNISGKVVITNNVAGRMLSDTSLYGAGGGGVYTGGTVTLAGDTQITGNWAYDGGGGILIGYGRQVPLTNRENATLPNFTMTGGIIAGNRAGVSIGENDSKILANIPEVWRGEGIITPDIRGGATTGSEGGGIRLEGTGTISGGSIVNNETLTTFDFGGGGIFIESYGHLTLHNAVITDNTADGFGGGVAACTNGTVTMNDGEVAIYHNSAGTGDAESPFALTHNEEELGDDWPSMAGILPKDENKDFAEDYFGARNSKISGTMLGGGNAAWAGYMGGGLTGSNNGGYATVTGEAQKDPEMETLDTDPPTKKIKTVTVVGENINTVTEGEFEVYKVTIPAGGSASASKLMALTSGYKGEAVSGNVMISGNTSSTHGGGIACNGELIFGAKTTPPPSSNNDPTYGSLTVTKTVTKSPNDKTEFEFTLTLSAEGSYSYTKYPNGGSGQIKSGDTFKLADGQKIVISSLPIDTEYTVTEKNADGYTTTSTGSSGKISAGENTAAFTNAKAESGSLTIRKFVDDPANMLNVASPEFTFTVTFPDTKGTYTLTYSSDREGRSDFKSGDTVTLTGGESAAVSGLPAGTKFTVTETKRGDLGTYTVTR